MPELSDAVFAAHERVLEVLRGLGTEPLSRLQRTTRPSDLVRSVDRASGGLWCKLSWRSRFTLIEEEKRRRATVEALEVVPGDERCRSRVEWIDRDDPTWARHVSRCTLAAGHEPEEPHSIPQFCWRTP